MSYGFPFGVAGRAAGLALRARQSVFARNAFYLTGITGVERVAGLIQTILLARALGITEYGIYGLLFSTIGFVSSVTGLQMGLTATVFVARYREHRKADAGAVIRYVRRFAFVVSAVVVVVVIPFARPLSDWLLKSASYHLALSIGCLFVAGSLVSGVQDGIVEGFEDFRSVALARLVGTVLTVSAIYPVAMRYGLDGALLVLLAGVAVKYGILAWILSRHRRRAAIPRHGGNVGFLRLIKDFSLPSMIVSLLLGAVMWYGTFLLSREAAGFAAVAIVSVGLQWRGPILLVTGALGRVAVPVFSRYEGSGGGADSLRFRNRLLVLNGVAVLVAVAIITACGHWILALYGKEFHGGWLVFAILLVSVIPKVLADVHMQELVGHGRIWRQLWLYVPLLVTAAAGFALLVPRWGGVGYAATAFVSAAVFLLVTTFASKYDPHFTKIAR